MKYLFLISLFLLSVLFFWQEATIKKLNSQLTEKKQNCFLKQEEYIKKLEKQLATDEEMIYQYYDSLQMVKDDYFILCEQFDSIYLRK